MTIPQDHIASYLAPFGEQALAESGQIQITGSDPVVNTPFRLGLAAALALAMQAGAVNRLWCRRSGQPSQSASIDITDAVISLNSVNHQRIAGYPVSLPDPIYPTIGFYQGKNGQGKNGQGKNGRWIFLHGGYPALRNGLLDLLDCPNDAEAIAAKVKGWDVFALEEAIAAKGLCGVVLRSHDEWWASPQGSVLAGLPVLEITKIGDSAPEPLPALPSVSPRPLSGVRVLDVTHVLAGPTAGKCLAEQGADVLHVGGPTLSTIPAFTVDTGHGKREILLHLRQETDPVKRALYRGDWGIERMKALLAEADILSQSFRPGALEGLGFGPEQAAAIRPGIIYVDVSCYGPAGPWALRPGWEQLAQVGTGLAAGTSSMESPALIAGAYPNDYITGYLAAYAALKALELRAEQGGSYHVKASLCQTAMWIQGFGTVPGSDLPPPPIPTEKLQAMTQSRQSVYGDLSFIGPVIRYSETPSAWHRGPVPLGADAPVWLPREG